jgi:multidrug resistance protein MdtO
MGHAVRQNPPAVDEGEPPGGLALLCRHLAPTPGRLGNTLRIVALVLISVTISEVFQMPDAALSAYIVFFVSKDEAGSTIVGSAVAGAAVFVAIMAAIVVFMLSLSEPALRIPLIALMTFAAMFLSRASPLGPVFFASGFIIAYGLTLGDEVLPLSLAPAGISNAAGVPALPELAFIPPEEALLHFLLWLAAAVGMPIALVIAANLATGRDPAVLWRDAIAGRLNACAQVCFGEPGAGPALSGLTREGSAALNKLAHLAGVLRKNPVRSQASTILTREVGRLCLVLLAWTRLSAPGAADGPLAAAGQTCLDAAHVIASDGSPGDVAPPLISVPQAGPVRPLAVELMRVLQAVTEALTMRAAPASPKAAAASAPRRLLAPDALTNPAYARFAFKVTLAVMLCYVGESLAGWPGIHTCIITCFFVSLDTVGETVHKATLRILGCLIGGALGIATILLLMPMMTDLGDLLVVIAVVTFLAGWVSTGSERIAYAGWQIAIAFFLAVLQGYGPTLDMQTARDRILGILVGDAVVFVIFTTIWPARVADAVRRSLSRGLDQLAELMAPAELQSGAGAAAVDHGAGFVQTIGQANALLVDDPYDPAGPPKQGAPRAITGDLLLQVQALIVPISVILTLGEAPEWVSVAGRPRDAVLAYHRAMSQWFHLCASWVRTGAGAADLVAALPSQPDAESLADGEAASREHCAERVAWYNALDRDIIVILEQVGPQPLALSAQQSREPTLATV